MSFDDLIGDRRLNSTATGHVLKQDPDSYALIVIDEAHNVRNPATLRAEAFRRLLSGRTFGYADSQLHRTNIVVRSRPHERTPMLVLAAASAAGRRLGDGTRIAAAG